MFVLNPHNSLSAFSGRIKGSVDVTAGTALCSRNPELQSGTCGLVYDLYSADCVQAITARSIRISQESGKGPAQLIVCEIGVKRSYLP